MFNFHSEHSGGGGSGGHLRLLRLRANQKREEGPPAVPPQRREQQTVPRQRRGAADRRFAGRRAVSHFPLLRRRALSVLGKTPHNEAVLPAQMMIFGAKFSGVAGV